MSRKIIQKELNYKSSLDRCGEYQLNGQCGYTMYAWLFMRLARMRYSCVCITELPKRLQKRSTDRHVQKERFL